MELQNTARSAAQTIQAVHQSGMVWTKLKSTNFVMVPMDQHKKKKKNKDDWWTSMQVKAIDLELAVPQNEPPIDFSAEAAPPKFTMEYLCGREPQMEMKQSFDIWSLGMLFYKMATGWSYFNTNVDDGLAIVLELKHQQAAVRAAAEQAEQSQSPRMTTTRMTLDLKKHVVMDIEEKNVVDPDMRDLIASCLEMDPNHQPTIQQVLDHPFFFTRQR
ncbi:hypothetical protein ACA910_020809 [Epithemia clementina (nom. ined.)]